MGWKSVGENRQGSWVRAVMMTPLIKSWAAKGGAGMQQMRRYVHRMSREDDGRVLQVTMEQSWVEKFSSKRSSEKTEWWMELRCTLGKRAKHILGTGTDKRWDTGHLIQDVGRAGGEYKRKRGTQLSALLRKR